MAIYDRMSANQLVLGNLGYYNKKWLPEIGSKKAKRKNMTKKSETTGLWPGAPREAPRTQQTQHIQPTPRVLFLRPNWFPFLAGLIIVLPFLIKAGETVEHLFLDLYVFPPALLTRFYGTRVGYLVALAQAVLLHLEAYLIPQRHPHLPQYYILIIAGSLVGVLLMQQISRLEQRLRERDLASQTWDPLTGALSQNAFLARLWELIQKTPGPEITTAQLQQTTAEQDLTTSGLLITEGSQTTPVHLTASGQPHITPDQSQRTPGESKSWPPHVEHYSDMYDWSASATKLLVGYLDLKDFEAFNQRWQWDTGDETLKRLAEILRSALPPGSPVARITSDEFAFCQVLSAEELNDFDPTRFIGQLQKSLAAVEPRAKDLEIHLGLAVYPEDGDKPEKLLWRAQRAMLEAQQKGSGPTELYRSMMDFLEVFQTSRSEDRLLNSAMTLLAVIDARDHYTGGHSIRVSRYAEILGRELGWPQDQLKVLALGALLHDLGKIEISRSILNKKKRLTDDEWSVIKLHPLFGVAVVSALGYMDDVVPIIRSHHERPDGQGYPDALSGAQIPDGALLIGVVDAFDSLRSHRPYRQALPRERALAVLRELSGRQFDPRLVEAFLQLDLSLIEKERHLVYFPRAASG